MKNGANTFRDTCIFSPLSLNDLVNFIFITLETTRLRGKFRKTSINYYIDVYCAMFMDFQIVFITSLNGGKIKTRTVPRIHIQIIAAAAYRQHLVPYNNKQQKNSSVVASNYVWKERECIILALNENRYVLHSSFFNERNCI